MVKLMKVPKSFMKLVEDSGGVDSLMNDFFINVIDYIKHKRDTDDFGFHIKSANFAYGSDKVNSNNRITYVEYIERYIVAGMVESRTAFNDIQFTFFRDLTCLDRRVSDEILELSNKRLKDLYNK